MEDGVDDRTEEGLESVDRTEEGLESVDGNDILLEAGDSAGDASSKVSEAEMADQTQ